MRDRDHGRRPALGPGQRRRVQMRGADSRIARPGAKLAPPRPPAPPGSRPSSRAAARSRAAAPQPASPPRAAPRSGARAEHREQRRYAARRERPAPGRACSARRRPRRPSSSARRARSAGLNPSGTPARAPAAAAGASSWMSRELRELAEIVGVRPLPGLVVGRAEQAAVVGRAGIGVERHRVVGPDAVAPSARRARRATIAASSSATSSRLACTNGTCLRASTSSAASSSVVSLQRLSSAARPSSVRLSTPASIETQPARPEQLDHLRLPQVDPGLHAELDPAAPTSASSSGAVRQEDLVDEVEILDPLRDQAVDLAEQRREVAAAVFVAEVDLGAEACRNRGSRATPRPRRRARAAGGRTGDGGGGAGAPIRRASAAPAGR